MSKRPPRHYWCACILNKLFNHWEPYADVVQELYQKALAGELTIVTSTMSLVEVNGGRTGTDEVRARIRQLFRAGTSTLEIIEVDRDVAEKAGTWAAAGTLKSVDAVHLATALLVKCDEMVTTDDRLLTCASWAEIPIHPPRLIGQGTVIPIGTDLSGVQRPIVQLPTTREAPQ